MLEDEPLPVPERLVDGVIEGGLLVMDRVMWADEEEDAMNEEVALDVRVLERVLEPL